jgi:DNA-binding NarL/FixJ family response regulator
MHLTTREVEVLSAMEKGFSAKEIAAQFAISPRTVTEHRRAAMRKLGARTIPQLMCLYLKSYHPIVPLLDSFGRPKIAKL